MDKAKLADILKYHAVKLFVKDKEHIRSFRLSNKVSLSCGGGGRSLALHLSGLLLLGYIPHQHHERPTLPSHHPNPHIR